MIIHHEQVRKADEPWWLRGLVVLAIGWYLWRRRNPLAMVVIALGAILLAQAGRAQRTDASGPIEETGRWVTVRVLSVLVVLGGVGLIALATQPDPQSARRHLGRRAWEK